MRSERALLPLYTDPSTRQARDRLEIVTTLVNGPSFDPLFRDELIRIPRGHRVYRWDCIIDRCERVREGTFDYCSTHLSEWRQASKRGTGKAAFIAAAEPLGFWEWVHDESCRICPARPATHNELRFCARHLTRWSSTRMQRTGEPAAFSLWISEQEPLKGYGRCRVVVCPSLADSVVGLCMGHRNRYLFEGLPGAAEVPRRWWRSLPRNEETAPRLFDDEDQFRAWCEHAAAVSWPGQINLRGPRPQVRAEIQWGLFMHGSRKRHSVWRLRDLQGVVNLCRAREASSLIDLDPRSLRFPAGHIIKEMLHELRLIYFSPDDTREAGFLETEQFGVKYIGRGSYIDLTLIPQRWLRDLVWDFSANLLRSPARARSATAIDSLRRACAQLGAFLELEAPAGGHDPKRLRAGHMDRFVADQKHREREGLPALASTGNGRAPAKMSNSTRTVIFNGVHRLLQDSLKNGAAEHLGLDREFVVAMPQAGHSTRIPRRPLNDEVARIVSDQANLKLLADTYDPNDHGLRDIWETILITGRRTNEVIKLYWDCLGRYGDMAMLWHDQTKVGNYDAAIRIPEHLYQRLAERQSKTAERFFSLHGTEPTPAERSAMALFPASTSNPHGAQPRSYSWFRRAFRQWIEQLDTGHLVPHQARHSLATNLLRAGASLTHIRRYLGHVSDRMAEHYVHLSHSDLDDILNHVWVTGPGAVHPGELLTTSTTPMTREQALALALDLTRRSTPAEGGFCTFQPVVDGGACPWNLDCHNCDKFVLSGADLLYWRRKREQWRLLAEGAPDDATATYLHQHFEPTARAIDGLEKALAGLGLLDDALALDLRKPQDYFNRVWSTAFRAADLADSTRTNGSVGQL